MRCIRPRIRVTMGSMDDPLTDCRLSHVERDEIVRRLRAMASYIEQNVEEPHVYSMIIKSGGLETHVKLWFSMPWPG